MKSEVESDEGTLRIYMSVNRHQADALMLPSPLE